MIVTPQISASCVNHNYQIFSDLVLNFSDSFVPVSVCICFGAHTFLGEIFKIKYTKII